MDIYPWKNDALRKVLGVPRSRHLQNFLLAPLIRRTGRVQYPSSHTWAWFTHIIRHTVAGEGPISLPVWSIFLDFQRCRPLSQLCRLPSRPSALTFSRNSGWSVQQSSGGCSVLPLPLQGGNVPLLCAALPLPPHGARGFAWPPFPNFLDLSLSWSHPGVLWGCKTQQSSRLCLPLPHAGHFGIKFAPAPARPDIASTWASQMC